MVVVKDLGPAALADAQVGPARSSNDTAVEPAQTERVDAELAEPLDDSLVRPAGVRHEEVVHGRRVGEAAHVAALGFDHPRRAAETRGEVVEVAARAVHDDGALGGGGDVLEERVEVADAAADLHDDHQMGYRPLNSSPSVSGNPWRMLQACTAWPADPFTRLSSAAVTTTRRECGSRSKPTSQ